MADERATQGVVNADPLLDKAQIAAYLGITFRFATILVDERRLDVTRVGRNVRVRRSALERFIAASTTPATRTARRDRWDHDIPDAAAA